MLNGTFIFRDCIPRNNSCSRGNIWKVLFPFTVSLLMFKDAGQNVFLEWSYYDIITDELKPPNSLPICRYIFLPNLSCKSEKSSDLGQGRGEDLSVFCFGRSCSPSETGVQEFAAIVPSLADLHLGLAGFCYHGSSLTSQRASANAFGGEARSLQLLPLFRSLG